ncbi:MAG: TRAP transporter large permease subunit [Chloroflexota bacterium]
MSSTAMTVLFIVSLLAGVMTGLPIAFVLIGLSALFLIVFASPTIAYATVLVSFNTMTTDVYIAIALFCFMAFTLEFSGIAQSLYEAMHQWFGGLRGGLAMGTVAICTVLAATTGLAATGVVTMGVIALPEMLKRGYNKDISVGCIPFGGTLGQLIPPSVLMIVVGGYAQLSIGKLFIGGIIPGLLMSLLAIIYIGVKCLINPEAGPAMAPEERGTFAERVKSLKGVVAPVLLIIAVLGGIYRGIATPTEAGSIGAIGALVCAAINHRFSLGNVRKAGLNTIKVMVMIMWLLVGGSFFSSLLNATGAGQVISGIMTGLPLGAYGILLVMMVIGLFLGMFIDAVAITMITIPVFLPVIYHLGFDPLWFGLLFTINMLIGNLTPPFGFGLFYIRGVTPPDISMGDIYRSVLPYTFIMLFVLVLGIVFPPLLTWLPNSMIK